MARFDWLSFVKQHGIPHVTEGPNFSRKMKCNIRCPFCGDSDPSEHMGLSGQGWWGCLRNSAHRGSSPHILVQRLLGCSPQEAKRITGVQEKLAPTQDQLALSFEALKRSVGADTPSRPRKLELLKEFKPLLTDSPFAEPFWEYLRERGFRDSQIEWLAKSYDLRYATRGPYAYRIIVPIYDRYGKLLTWTARSIRPDATLRYKTLRASPDDVNPDAPVALAADKETVLGLPVLYAARNPRALVLVEGPFDALKITAFGWGLGVYAAALFGLNVSPAQVSEALELSRRFERVYLLLDAGAELHRLRLSSVLSVVSPTILRVPDGYDDPGDMSPEATASFALKLISGQLD